MKFEPVNEGFVLSGNSSNSDDAERQPVVPGPRVPHDSYYSIPEHLFGGKSL